MSATQATVTSTQVVVKYRQNARSLSIDMSVKILTDTQPICRLICRPAHLLGQYFGLVSAALSTDMLVDMSTDTSVECQSICRLIYRSRGAQNTHDPAGLWLALSTNENWNMIFLHFTFYSWSFVLL